MIKNHDECSLPLSDCVDRVSSDHSAGHSGTCVPEFELSACVCDAQDLEGLCMFRESELIGLASSSSAIPSSNAVTHT